MKKALFAIVCLAATVATAAWKAQKGYDGMVNARRVCVGREIAVIGGVTNIITRWERAGKPDWIKPAVETNAVKVLRGKKQNNALENEAKVAKEIKAAKKNAAKKDAKNLEKAIADLEKARSKSSAAMQAVYDPIIKLLKDTNL